MDEIHRILKDRPWRHRPRRCLSRSGKLAKKRAQRTTAALIGLVATADNTLSHHTYDETAAPVVEFHCEFEGGFPATLDTPHPEAQR